MSRTLPFMANSLNSPINPIIPNPFDADSFLMLDAQIINSLCEDRKNV
jgi:hypothetical protein